MVQQPGIPKASTSAHLQSQQMPDARALRALPGGVHGGGDQTWRGRPGQIDRETCSECLLCAKACPSLALNVYGEIMTVDQVIRKVEEDSAFYSRSGGGLTLGGGSRAPGGVCIRLLKEATPPPAQHGHGDLRLLPVGVTQSRLRALDTLLYDIKIMDAEKHQPFTGVSNEIIFRNRTGPRDLPTCRSGSAHRSCPGSTTAMRRSVPSWSTFGTAQRLVRGLALPSHGQP